MSTNDLKDAVRESFLFPLTARTRLAQEYRNKLEKAWEHKEKCRTLRNQIKSVGIIQEHIAKQKRTFLCHQSERIKNQNRRRLDIEEKLLTKFNVDVPNSLKTKIADRLIKHTKAQRKKLWKQNERILNISRKLSKEVQEKEKAKLPKIIKKRTRKLMSNLPGDVSHFETCIEDNENIEIEEEEKGKQEMNEDWEDLGEEMLNTQLEKEIRKKSKKRERKKSEIKKSKIISDEQIKEIKTDLPDLREINKEKEFSYPKDSRFTSKPSIIIFNDFINEKKYKQKVTVINTCSNVLYCKFENIQSNNNITSEYIRIKQIPFQKVFPGSYFHFTIYFHPKNVKCLEGNIIFLISQSNENDIKQFEIPFQCKTAISYINVIPVHVEFKSIPIWEMQKLSNNNYNIIEIENNLLNKSILIIRKVKDEFEEKYESVELEQIVPQPPEEEKEISKKGKRRKTKKKIETINLEDENRKIAQSVAEYIIEECTENIVNNFYFDTYYLEIQPKDNIQLKVYFKSVPIVGIFQEKYRFEFLERKENEFESVKMQDILVQAEITDKFIQTETDYLDFHICVLNSVYQQSFTVFNKEHFSVKLGFRFPSKLKEYLTIYPQILYLKSGMSENVFVKFIPRKEILNINNIKYYDPCTNILNFPIKICLLSSKQNNIPPTILTVYAILTEPDGLKLRLNDDSSQGEENSIPILNIGQVTTHETVLIDFEIGNLSAVVHEFGFLNVPEYVTMWPNYGFGIIEPNKSKKIKLHISPTIKDINNVYPDSIHVDSIDITTKLTCTTLFQSGGIKENKSKRSKNDLKEVFKKSYNDKLEFDSLDNENIENFKGDGKKCNNLFIQSEENLPEPNILRNLKQNTKNLSILVKATLIDYWIELSHQYVVFPDTPVGSYTTMDIQISAINNSSQTECLCGFEKKNEAFNFGCHFEIFGGCDDISIEPICGNLVYGQSKKLTIIAKPVVENHLLQETAKSYKLQSIETSKRIKKKGKKTMKTENLENISLQNFDIYAAEKELWKTMKPHTIKTLFTFVVTFEKDLTRKPEMLYLTAECKIIRPDFISNTETQYINFGPTGIYTRPKRIIEIENISRKIITPEISHTSPAGPFSCSISREMKLEKEHMLKIPLTFAPDKEINYKEYLEIKSGNTTERLIIAGEGVLPEYEFSPKFTVCRIESTLDKFADCVFQISNTSKAPLIIEVVKVCELKGIIQKKPAIINEATDKDNNDLKGKGKSRVKGKDQSVKTNKTDKKQKEGEKKQKVKKFSENLTTDEEFSIENFFEVYDGETQFKIMNLKNNKIIVEPVSKSKIKIRFEYSKPQENAEKETNVKLKEKGKKSKGKKAESAKSSKVSKISKLNKKDEDVSYVSKFNLLMGGVVLIKDFVIIAKFK